MSQSPPQTLTLDDGQIHQPQTLGEPIDHSQTLEEAQNLEESAAEANKEAELRELGEEIKREVEKREEQKVPQADGVAGPSIDPPIPKPRLKRRKPVSAAQAERKLALLQGNFNPIPFSPNRTLDFSAHEELFRVLNLWEFVNLDLDEEIRPDLLIILIANYESSERRSFVGNVEISVTRLDLVQALKLPVENESGEELQDMFLRSESKEVIEEFLSNYVLLEDENEDDMCILPEAVVVASQLVKEGRANKVDWAGLMWVLVEKELSAVPMSKNYHYASHLQCLMKFQQPGLFETDAGAEAFLVPEPESSMEASDSSMDEEDDEDEYDDEDGCGINMRGIEEFENGDCERQGSGLGLGMGENGSLMDGIEDCKGSEEGDWVDDGKDVTFEHCLRRCNSIGVRGMEYENLCKEEQVESEEFSNFRRLNSTGLLHTMEAEMVQGSFCPRMNPLDLDTGDFVSMGVDGNKNMPVDTEPGSSLVFENNGKRHINSVDIDEEEIDQFHQNNQQKRMRCGGIWEEQVPSGFDSYMEQIQCTIGKAKMLYAEKEQACIDGHLQLQCLNQMLEQKDQFIHDLEKTRVEEHQTWQHTVQRYQQELNTVANLVVNYKNALKQLQSKFQEYRMKCPQGDEPLYRDVGGAGGLVVTSKVCERLRLEKEEEMRQTAEEMFNCFECDWFPKFEEYNDEVILLHGKLVALEGELQLIKESYAECKNVEVVKKGKSVRHLWSDNQISILIQLLKEHDDPQWRVHTGWSKEAWTKITSKLNAKFGTQGVKLTRDQVKEKEHGLKRKFKLFKELVEESGFGWDNEMQCVVAPPDVWEDLKEGKKKVPASLYKLKGKRFPNYDDCFDIYEGRYAEGKRSRGPEDYTTTTTTTNNDNDEDDPLTPLASLHATGDASYGIDDAANDNSWTEYEHNMDYPLTENQNVPPPTTTPAMNQSQSSRERSRDGSETGASRGNSRKRFSMKAWRKKYAELKEKETDQIVEVTLEAQRVRGQLQLANIVKQGEIARENMERQLEKQGEIDRYNMEWKLEKRREFEDRYSTKNCMDAYHMLSGFNDYDYRKAHHVFKDVYNREFFLSMPVDKRGAWIREEFDCIP